MKISKSIETPSGEITFNGVLSPEEVDLILSVGLNYLFQQGALPLKIMEEKNMMDAHDGSEELQ